MGRTKISTSETPLHISDLKGARYNPRKITPEEMHALKKSMKSFGDISGITFNKRTGNLVSGHQRMKTLMDTHGIDGLEIKDNKIHDSDGKVWPIRIVDWDESKEKAANIAANSRTLQGRFDDNIVDLLQELETEVPELANDLGFDRLLDEEFPPEEIDRLMANEDLGEEIEAIESDERVVGGWNLKVDVRRFDGNGVIFGKIDIPVYKSVIKAFEAKIEQWREEYPDKPIRELGLMILADWLEIDIEEEERLYQERKEEAIKKSREQQNESTDT